MTKYLSREEVEVIHDRALTTGEKGEPGIRDAGLVDSALAQPRATYGGAELNPTLVEKAATLCFSFVKNHAFVDGNKRTAHAVTEAFLAINGWEIRASVDEQEQIITQLADNSINRDQFTDWLRDHLRKQKIKR